MWPRSTVTPVGGTSANLIVLFSEEGDGVCEVEADLLGIDVEGRDELEVANVIRAELDVHEAGDLRGRIGVFVVFERPG